MKAEGRAAAAISRMAQLRREMSERRALRDRKATLLREKSLDSLRKQAAAMEQVARQASEQARRQQAAGGWSTEKTVGDKDYVMSFGSEDEESPANPYAHYRPPAATTRPDDNPGGLGELAEEAPVAEEPVAQPARQTPPDRGRPAAERAPRQAQQPVLDDDDFSNQSWMTNQ